MLPILTPHLYEQWLASETGPDEAMDMALDDLGDQLTAHRVSRDVGKVSNNHAGLVEPLAMDA